MFRRIAPQVSKSLVGFVDRLGKGFYVELHRVGLWQNGLF